VHATLLTVALLWPHLQVPPVIPRPDLVAHCLAFGPFCLLLCLWNPLDSRGWRVVAFAAALGLAYGAATELLQSIPGLRRSAAVDDWLADAAGVACGVAAFAAVKMWWPSRWPRAGRPADT